MGESTQGMRQALAGLNYLQGMSAAKALTEAGYSPATASNPTANGLMAERCVQAAVETFPEIAPAKLVAETRRLLESKLALMWNPDGTPSRQLKQSNLAHVARFVDVVEKWYTPHGTESWADGRDFANRLAWLSGVMQRAKELQAAAAVTGESEPVTASLTATRSDNRVICKPESDQPNKRK